MLGIVGKLQKYKDKREEGFTIIEVLIVLAIAGLIILIVFLAVPALQRNSRNTQRTNDAAKVAAAWNECMNNNNGLLFACDSEAEVTVYVDFSTLQQLTSFGAPSLNSFSSAQQASCTPDGTSYTSGGGRWVLLYQVETANGGVANRCLDAGV